MSDPRRPSRDRPAPTVAYSRIPKRSTVQKQSGGERELCDPPGWEQALAFSTPADVARMRRHLNDGPKRKHWDAVAAEE